MNDTFRLEVWEGWQGWCYTLAITLFFALLGLSLAHPFALNALLSFGLLPQMIYLSARNRPVTLLVYALTWLVVVAVWTGGLACLRGGEAAAGYLHGTDGVAAVQGGLHGLPAADVKGLAAGQRELALYPATSLLSAGLVGLNLLTLKLNLVALTTGLIFRAAPPAAVLPWALFPYAWLQLAGGLVLIIAAAFLSVRIALRQEIPWLNTLALWAGGLVIATGGLLLEWSLAPSGMESLRQSLRGVELLS